ncbi:hypothetical protein B0H66DRAFT_388452 [Apodospora peruviana]|uniref:Uncharacterized protein n=1 Tax=Apodospora peruviana TaxID=516989 RepID=A0AAE0HUN0_9PEZI|nr:hypothetical protein B0H66DRAFT_388452 [Apodospora peruviana]
MSLLELDNAKSMSEGMVEKCDEDPILGGLDKSDFPNLFEFVQNARQPGSRASRTKATIDLFNFSGSSSNPSYEYIPPDPPTETRTTSQAFFGTDETRLVLVVENIDLAVIEKLLTGVSTNSKASFLHFLDDFLDDSPSYNFGSDVTPNIPVFQSNRKLEEHVKFYYNHYRKFERNFELGYDESQIAAQKSYWRNTTNYGRMCPCQRSDRLGGQTNFEPIMITRKHCAVWFDTDRDGNWKTGIVLVEPPTSITTLPERLSPPLYPKALGRDILPKATAETSYRTSFSLLTKQTLDWQYRGGSTLPQPSPLFFLQGVYRIMAAEWMVIHTYCLRDINTIEWRMQAGRKDAITTVEEAETVNLALFWMRQRLNRYRSLAREHMELYSSRAQTSWNPGSGQLDQLSEELMANYQQVVALLDDDFNRVQQIISYGVSLAHIQQSKLGVKEAEQSTEQNRMVLVLTIMATVLLPISTIATVLSMDGEWAPGGAKFGLFWGVSLAVSSAVVVCMATFMFWGHFEAIGTKLATFGHTSSDKKDGAPSSTEAILVRSWTDGVGTTRHGLWGRRRGRVINEDGSSSGAV